LYEPHLLCQDDSIRVTVFEFLALTVCLAFTEYAAADVSFSTVAGASGTFHKVTLQRHFIWQINDGISLGRDILHGKPIVMWDQWKVSQATDLHIGCNMTFHVG